MTDAGHLLNQSDGKKRNILPSSDAHTRNVDAGEAGCGAKAKKYKWYIIGGIVVALVAVIIGVTVGKKDDPPVPPGPGPGPVPPGPAPDGYNPYSVADSDFHQTLQLVTGNLIASPQKIAELNAQPILDEGADVIKADPRLIPQGLNNQLLSNVSFEFGQAGYQLAYARFTDAQNERFSIPESLANKPGAQGTMRLDMCGFELMKDPFGFKFVDTRDRSNVLLTTEGSTFVMYDKYMQLDIQLPSRRIYGLGERTHEFTLGEGTWTMWSNGQETPHDDGKGGKQTYGVHPFVLVQTGVKGEYMGLYFRNSNAMSPVIRYTGVSAATFSYITTGGQMEVYFMFKGTAKQIIAQYHDLIGRPALPPFWSLGWHAAAYAYSTQALVEENIKGYSDNNFPLEGVWLDIDFMDGYADFSVNTTAFPTVKALADTLHANGQRMVVIVDAGISGDDVSNPYFAAAAENDVLLRSSINPDQQSGILTQHVWPNHTVFLDFLAPGARDIWAQGLKDLHDQVPYDGLWLDMNEATGFCNGECPSGQTNYTQTLQEQIKEKLSSYLQLKDDSTDIKNFTWWYGYSDQDTPSTFNLPFVPGGRVNLDNMSLSLNATHPSNNETEYNLHSLFGHSEGKLTSEILTDDSISPLKNKRPFLLSRSTFAGSGQYVQHWLGDNHRTWEDMKASIAGVMNFNMFGIPLVGPDTCGFFGESGQDELCARWVQLATFYPFARQHRDKFGGGDPNEVWRLAEPYKTWARNALFDRLQYVRHMYTCLFDATQSGQTCFDPILFHYPTLDQAFENTEHTFIVGNALKVSPVLEAGVKTTYEAFFPNGRWVSMKKYSDVLVVDDPSGGANQTLTAPEDTVNVHLMPGAIAIVQDNSDQSAKLTKDMLAKLEITLVVNRDEDKHAEGKLFLDDGETISQLKDKTYEFYNFVHNQKSFMKHNLNEENTVPSGNFLYKLIITDAEDLADTDFACYTKTDGGLVDLSIIYDKDNKALNISTKTDPINFFDMQAIFYGTKGKDMNLCHYQGDNYGYRVRGDLPDLTKASASMILDPVDLPSLRSLTMDLSILKSGVINMKWTYQNLTDPEIIQAPFEVPTEIIDVDRTSLSETLKLVDFVTITQTDTGAMTLVVKNQYGNNLYSLNGLYLAKYINIIDANLTVNATGFNGVMGLFEQTSSNLFLKDGIYSLWARDTANPEQTGKLPGQNLYGTHPFVMGRSQGDGTKQGWFGVFTNLAAAQDWRIVNDADQSTVSMKVTATGGMGDVFIMLAEGPNEVVQLYQTVVGKPVLTPQWALGWNQCKWGYTNIKELQDVVDTYRTLGLPLDTQWSDIDYLDRYRDFTFDPVNFAGLGEFVEDLHKHGQHYIPILDAGVAKRPEDGYQAYDDGVSQDIFIKHANGGIFTGQVWPDDAAFPDYLNPKSVDWLKTQLSRLHDQVGFDGIWEDMNEASNFCNGVCYDNEKAKSPVKNKLPYIPSGRDLETKSISLDAIHSNGYTELDTHSLYGTSMVRATHEWFKSQNRRTMIIERSAYAGAGKFASRWLGDNFARQEYMGYSVTGVMAHNIIGIPLAGADICGFIEDTTPELCARWYTLGAFYPFSRNHNNWGQTPQEPWVFARDAYEGNTSFYEIIKIAMYTKMHMIRYYHTQLTMLNLEGGAFFKPLFFEFPDDALAYTESQEDNIMLGKGLKLSINAQTLDKNSTDFYIPTGTWCSVFDSSPCVVSTGKKVTLQTKAYNKYVHLRDGYIVPMQDGKDLVLNQKVTTTAALQTHPVQLHLQPTCVAGAKCTAAGDYINDDGLVLDLTNNMNRYQLTYTHDQGATPATLTLSVARSTMATNYDNDHVNNNDILDNVQIYNAKALGLDQTFNVSVTTADGKTTQPFGTATYNATFERLQFTNMQDITKNDIWMTDISVITFDRAS